MKQYTLVIIPPNGERNIIDPRAFDVEVSAHERGTLFRFMQENGEVVLRVNVSSSFSYTFESKELPQ